METLTVTPAAPVAATTEETTQEFSVQESLNKATSAELEHWQNTGELPGEKKSTPAAEKTAEGDDKTQAASSTATTQEKTAQQQRTQRTSENRWQKLSRELRETRAENERLKAVQPTAKTETPREVSAETRSAQPEAAAAKTAANPRPKLDDVDKDGNPKFKTYAEYEEAKDTWLQDEAVRKVREESTQTEQQKAQAAAKTRVNEEIQQRVEQARKDYDDYDEVVASGVAAKDDAGRELIFIPEGSHLQAFFLDSDRGQDVLYEILKDPDAHAAIFARNEKGDRFTMPAIRQLRELAKIEAGLKPKVAAAAGDDKTAASPAPKRTPPKLPAPPTELGARNSAPADEADAALARGDTAAYMRIVNQRETKARK